MGGDPAGLVQEITSVSSVLDVLGLMTTEMYQKGREEVIARQQQELMELSTPSGDAVEGVLALPADRYARRQRTQVVMENLLQRIVESGSTRSRSSTLPVFPPWTRWWRSTSSRRFSRTPHGRRLHHQWYPASGALNDSNT